LLAVAPVAAQPPNVVLIMADDMGWSDIGCYGGEIRTPNIDRLAAEGLRFTQFYNNAKCTTTRASLVTGLYPRRGGELLKEGMVTIAEVLRDVGYGTALSGKWHLGSKAPRRPIDVGFDDAYGLWDGCCNFFDPSQRDPAFKGSRVRFFAHNEERITSFPDDFYTTDAFTDHAVDSIQRFADEQRPFFLHVCYTAPHYPLHALPEDIARYSGRYDEGWDALRLERHQRQIELGLIDAGWTLPPRDPEAVAYEDAPHKGWQARRMEVYAAMVDRMDQGIGRILAALDDHDLTENTIVMFLSDNGGCAEIPGGERPERIPGPKEHYTTCGPGWAYAQNTPFRRYKTWMHEGGIATPFVVRWPKRIAAGGITHQVGHIIDVLPTCAAAAGAEQRDGIEGRSLLEIFDGEQREQHDALFWAFNGSRAVRMGKWKACYDRKVKRWELYDLDADRTESDDLASEHPARLEQMTEAWQAWGRRTGVVKQRKREPPSVKLPDQYKRVHQLALRHVLSDDNASATAVLDAVDARGEDPETSFIRALGHAARGKRRAARLAAEEALRRGLEPGRLIAGPRELLTSVAETGALADLAVNAGPLVHGPMVGAVSASTARIWLRAAEPGQWRARAGGVAASANATEQSDYTAVIELSGLAAGERHQFTVEDSDGEVHGRGEFRTPPLAGRPARFSVAFGGGAGYVPAHERMWDTIKAAAPDLLLLLGDNVYIDDPTSDAMQRYCYYRRQSVPSFRGLVSTTSVLSIWDDHDFGTNDCAGGPEVNKPLWKPSVWRRFTQNWANPDYGGGAAQPGCWYTWSHGDVDFFMLDGRYYRTPPRTTPAAQRSMLGPQQRAWLLRHLAESRATFKVICSPVPWDYRTKGDSLDTWNGFRQERAAIFSFLAAERIDGVVLVSADRHRSDAWRIERSDAYDLYEFNSSRLTNEHVHQTMSEAEFSYNAKQSFGLLEFDTTLSDPAVTYTVRSIDGEDVAQMTLRRSQLRSP